MKKLRFKIKKWIINMLFSEYEQSIIADSLEGFEEGYSRYAVLSASCATGNIQEDVMEAQQMRKYFVDYD